MARVSTLQLEKAGGRQTLNISVPNDIGSKPDDFAHLGKQIVAVIKNHTGCSCLSGNIRVVLEDEMADAIRVEM